MTPIRCWLCGVEPEDVTEVRAYAGGRWFLPDWPDDGADHEHAERPPTPADLVDAGSRALERIRTMGWS